MCLLLWVFSFLLQQSLIVSIFAYILFLLSPSPFGICRSTFYSLFFTCSIVGFTLIFRRLLYFVEWCFEYFAISLVKSERFETIAFDKIKRRTVQKLKDREQECEKKKTHTHTRKRGNERENDEWGKSRTKIWLTESSETQKTHKIYVCDLHIF